MGVDNNYFINACFGRNSGRIPVWIMRQAGRYLKEYRDVRSRVSFADLCRTPELIAQVVRQPVARFDLDAAILFSDILTMLEPMGAEVSFPEGGPKIANPIESTDDVRRLRTLNAAADLAFVLEGIRAIKKDLPRTPLIGFAGSPFTLACYLIEGGGSRNFDKARGFLHREPAAAERLFDCLTTSLSDYLNAQIDAGADAIQLFESWGGVLSRDDFREWVVRPINRILAAVNASDHPRIVFVNNIGPFLDLVADIDCDVVGVDYRVDLNHAAQTLHGKALQGNLDPAVLHGTPEHVVDRTRRILESFSDHNRLIFNLGHGIQPKTPEESVAAMVETVHAYRS